MKKVKSILFGLLLYLAVYGVAQALTPSARPVDTTNNHKYLIENADYIISGEVTLIQYEHIPYPDSQGVPTTLVTYQVKQVFHGKIESDSFVRLRFLGGHTEDGGFLPIPFIPQFAPGDQDVLFVMNNGISECPLVGCLRGRIRINSGFLENSAMWYGRVALTLDGTNLYPAVEPIEPGDIHTYDDYRQKLMDIVTTGQFSLKSSSPIILDARTVEYIPSL